MVIDYKFYDTCSLLLKAGTLFDNNEPFAISSITLNELEDIKTSPYKDAEQKYAARKLLHILKEHRGEYDVHIFTEDMLQPIIDKHLTITNDTKILATAINYDNTVHPDETVFVTDDNSLFEIANLFFGEDSIESVGEEEIDHYQGYLDLTLNESEMEQFYQNWQQNTYNLLPNQYLVIRSQQNEIVDRLCYTGTEYRPISFESFDSKHFGVIKPIDVQQQFVADSLTHNQLTMIKGPAGSGKTLIAFGFLFQQLERHKIDKIIIFCNTVAAKNAARLGYLPGSREEKLLDSQIGNVLISKLGSRVEVERLLDEEKLILLPMSDIRGYDTTGLRAGIYFSEAQNLDISLMKLGLQRIGEDSICIIDGDEKTQVDDISFAGANNGMRRASKVFRGSTIYGEIELKEIHRSTIGKIAEKM